MRFALAGLGALAIAAVATHTMPMASAATSCESLVSLALPGTTITAAQSIAAVIVVPGRASDTRLSHDVAADAVGMV